LGGHTCLVTASLRRLVGTYRLWGLRGAPARTSLGVGDRLSRHASLFGLDNLRLGAQWGATGMEMAHLRMACAVCVVEWWEISLSEPTEWAIATHSGQLWHS
jgi:hypothetical protein